MSTPVKLPELGESVTEGTITRWLKQVGDTVEVDEPLLEVSTDKVDTEIPSPVAGKILEIKAEEDETVEVGAELCIVGDEGEDAGSDDSEDSADSEDSGGDAEDSADADESEEESGDDEDTDSDDAAEEDTNEEADEQETEEEKTAAKKDSGGGGGGGGGGKPVKLPELGESVTEGTITRWLKSVGDEVEVDEPLVEVSTDKVDTEIPSPLAGTLLEIKAEEDETVEVGAELCIIGDASDAPDDSGDSDDADAGDESDASDEAEKEEPEAEPEAEEDDAEEEAADEEAEDEAEDEEPAAEEEAAAEPEPKKAESKPESKSESKQEEPAKSSEGGTYVTPLVRKMAAEHGVDLDSIEGTGVGGRIRKQDVLAAAESGKTEKEPAAAGKHAAAEAEPSPLRGKTEPMSRLRKVIAKRMVESLQTSAQLTQVFEVDVTNIARLRDSVKADFLAREGVKLSYLPFFAKAAVDALKSHPALNATFDLEAGEVTYHESENVAFAVDTEKGLLTPVVKDAGDLSIAGLAKKIADVAERTRTNKIGPDDLSGGTFTITNLGSVGALWDTPIINKPQVAILGPGSVVKRAVVIDDPNLGETIAVRHMVYLALTYDHQLVDGADAGRFLTDVKARLESGKFDV